MDSFTLSLLGLCGFTLLFDRFFCGYACAFGSLGDAVWALSGLIQKKLFHRKKQLRLPERAVLLGQKVKYLLLAWLVALYVTRQEKMLTGASPWERCLPCCRCYHLRGCTGRATAASRAAMPVNSSARCA